MRTMAYALIRASKDKQANPKVASMVFKAVDKHREAKNTMSKKESTK